MHGFGNEYSGSLDGIDDILIYNSTTVKWYWMAGEETSSTKGTFGTKGVTSIQNLPPRRTFFATVRATGSGKVILFGGTNYAYPAGDMRHDDVGV